MKKNRWEFEVTGRGAFPVDMLRYDACFPTRTEDAVAIGASVARNAIRPRVVRLASAYHEPTVGRWESFGWRVGAVGEFSRRAG